MLCLRWVKNDRKQAPNILSLKLFSIERAFFNTEFNNKQIQQLCHSSSQSSGSFLQKFQRDNFKIKCQEETVHNKITTTEISNITPYRQQAMSFIHWYNHLYTAVQSNTYTYTQITCTETGTRVPVDTQVQQFLHN